MVMRPPAGLPSLSKRAKRVLLTIGALIVLAILWFQFVGIYVDWEWYGEVGLHNVYATQFVTRIILFVIATLGAGAVVLFSLLMAFRSRPVFVPTGEVDPLSPYRTVVSSRPRLFAITIAVIVGVICGLSAQGRWQTVQLFLHSQTFGTQDPQFHHDVGFYVFRLPFLQMILSWLFVAVALSFFAVLITQYLYGGIRLSGSGRRISSAATLQLSLLIGAFVLVKAVQYWFDRYELLFSDRGGKFTGASYTDVNAVLPAKIILMVIAGICAVGFIVGAFLRSIRLPAVALALLVLSSVLIGGVWPLVLQQVVVNPNGITKEPPYIAKNIDATRAAYGIGSDKVKYIQYSDQTSSVQPTAAETDTIASARLLDPNILSSTFTQNEQQKNFYGFSDPLSVDRYKDANGVTQDYIVALRELNTDGLTGDQTNWIQEHMVYTHGNGFVAAPANQVGTDGYPKFTVSDVSNSGAIKVDQPRIYYGALATTYAIVGSTSDSSKREYDTDSTSYTYTGTGGVAVGSLFNRLVFATNYGDANFLFSSEINSNSKIMYNRDPLQRVALAAPFLTTDSNPYPAVVDGKVVWIVDAYTTAENYPYSQNISLQASTNNSQTDPTGRQAANTNVSYIRNSVKATVDAYNGTVTLYSVNDSDPVLKAWEGVFPNLITPNSDIPQDLRAHFRYPQDLFEVQRKLLTQYHVDSAVDFFQNSNYWDVPTDPTESGNTAVQPPYYQQLTLPQTGNSATSFQLTSALTIYQRQFMAAFVSASSDPDTYGKLTVYQLPQNTQTPGPVLIQQAFNSNQAISNFVTTRQSNGRSQVTYGNLLTLPTDNGLLYIEPLYIKGVSTSASPQLGQVLVWYANRVGYGITLSDALAVAASSAPVTITPGTGTGTTPTSSGSSDTPSVTSSASPGTPTVLPSNQVEALAQMDTANKALTAAKASGDLGKIGQATQDLENAVTNYLRVAGTSLPSTSPGVVVTPSK